MKNVASTRLLAAALAVAGIVGVAHAEITTVYATASGSSVEDATDKVKSSLRMQCDQLSGVLIGDFFVTSTVGYTVSGEQRCTN